MPSAVSCSGGGPSFDPVVQWAWEDGDLGVIVTPTVGDIDGDGISDVVFTAAPADGTFWNMPGELIVVSGDGSATELLRTDTLVDPLTGTEHQPSGRGNVALGDLDGDSIPEICVVTVDASVACVNHTGALSPLVKFVVAADGASTSPIHAAMGPPAIADMDGDGDGELVWGRQAFDHTGALAFASPGGIGSPGGHHGLVYAGIIGQADSDSLLELITSTTPYDSAGGENWYYAWDGMAASADLDLDGTAEVVATYTWWQPTATWDWFPAMRIAYPDGSEVHVELDDGDWSGPPTIANFDLDPELEIAVSSRTLLRVFDTDLSLLWSTPIEDSSSGNLAATAVDWDGDGVWELLHADEQRLALWDVDDNLDLLDIDCFDGEAHRSGTHIESPAVADLDGDGSLEFIVSSNRGGIGEPGWNGIHVIGSQTASWAGSGRVWNQHAYVPGHINDDLSLVSTPALSPEGFRAARSIAPAGGAALSDLRIVDAETCEDCPDQLLSWVAMANVGTADAGNFVVSAYDPSGDLVYQESVLALAAGDWQWMGPMGSNASGSYTWVVDDFALIEECDETDNSFSMVLDTCD